MAAFPAGYQAPPQSYSCVEGMMRLCTFQVGVLRERWSNQMLLPRLCTDGRLDPTRVQASMDTLIAIGGIACVRALPAGAGSVDYMLLTQNNLRQSILNHGGKIAVVPNEQGIDRTVFCQDRNSATTALWPAFKTSTLDRMGWESITILESPGAEAEEVILFEEGGSPLSQPEVPTNASRCFIRCHSPAQTYPWDRDYVGKHLTLGDVLIFDYPGTREGTGIASEASYYESVEAMLHQLLERNYQHNQIIVTGFCLGSAVAAYLLPRYHQEGLHLVLEHAPPSIQTIIDNQMWLPRQIALVGLSGLRKQATETSQDDFNTLDKLTRLTGASNNLLIFVSTSTDAVVPPAATATLIEAATPHVAVRYVERDGTLTPGVGHDDLPLKDRTTWEAYKAAIRAHIP